MPCCQNERVVVRMAEGEAPVAVLVSPLMWQQTTPNLPTEHIRPGDQLELNWVARDCDEKARRVRAILLRKI